MKKFIGLALLVVAFNTLSTGATSSNDWSCVKGSPWGGGISAKLDLKLNEDGTYKITYSTHVLDGADRPVLNVQDLVLAENAHCEINGQLVWCEAPFSDHGQYMIVSSKHITTDSLNEEGQAVKYSVVDISIRTSQVSQVLTDLAFHDALHFAVKADAPQCGVVTK